MAYQGGYGGQPPRPPPQRQYPGGSAPPPQQYNQNYDQRQGDYAYDDYGYDQGYGAPYADGYAQPQRGAPPQRDPYGPAPGRGAPSRGRGGPMNAGRGVPRPPTADGHRGYGPSGPARPLNGAPPGRGRPPPFAQPHSDPSSKFPLFLFCAPFLGHDRGV